VSDDNDHDDNNDDENNEEESMAGTQTPIIRRTTYKFGALVTTHETLLTPLLDTIGWVSGVLMVRVYARSGGGNYNFKVVVHNAMVSPEDPNTVLTPVAAVTPVATATINYNDANPPALYAVQFNNPIARFVKVVLQYTPTAATEGVIDLGVDLVGRSA
jgi:hypothetical protein